MQTVVVTGAAGGIGTRLRQLLPAVYPNIRWSDRVAPADLAARETFVKADLTVMSEVEAARRRGVERVVFASSNHAIGYYPRQRRIGTHDPVRPDSRYGVSKAFGEALGALYAYKHGLRVTSI